MSSFITDLIANDILIDRADFCRRICPEATPILLAAIEQMQDLTLEDDEDDDEDRRFFRVPSEILRIYGIKSWMDCATRAAVFIDRKLVIGRDVQPAPWVSITSDAWYKMTQHPGLKPTMDAYYKYSSYYNELMEPRLREQEARLREYEAELNEREARLQQQQQSLDNQRLMMTIRQTAMVLHPTLETVAVIEELIQRFDEPSGATLERAQQVLEEMRARID